MSAYTRPKQAGRSSTGLIGIIFDGGLLRPMAAPEGGLLLFFIILLFGYVESILLILPLTLNIYVHINISNIF